MVSNSCVRYRSRNWKQQDHINMIRVYLIFLFFLLSPQCVLILFSQLKTCLPHSISWKKTSVRTVVGLMQNDCEENFKRDMPPTQAHRWNLMRRSSGGPDNDLFGAHLLHSKTDQTTYQEKA